MVDTTPGMARTAASAALRTGSQACTAPASTLIEKYTLPSLTTMSDSLPLLGSGVPSGDLTPSRPARISALPIAMPCTPSPQHKSHGGAVNAMGTRGLTAPLPRRHERPNRSPCRASNGGSNGEGGVSGPGRDGLPDGRASQEQGRARRHRLQPHHRQGREMGLAVRRQGRQDPEGGGG